MTTTYQRKPQEYFHEQVMTLTRLPTLPVIAMELMEVTRSDRLSVNQILPIIEKDPPLAMKVLKIANSAYYGLHQKVESLRHALVIIGLKELGDLALGFSVFRAFSEGQDPNELRWKMLWEHSAACGHVAQLLQKELKLSVNSSPYALGLLHDIGKLILYKLEPEAYLDCLQAARETKVYSHVLERERIGVDHMQVGAWIAEKWQLPQAIVHAMGYHHRPAEVEEDELRTSTALIQLADLVCNLQELSFGTDYVRSIPREEEGWVILQEKSAIIRDMDFERFILGIEEELETIRNLVLLISD